MTNIGVQWFGPVCLFFACVTVALTCVDSAPGSLFFGGRSFPRCVDATIRELLTDNGYKIRLLGIGLKVREF